MKATLITSLLSATLLTTAYTPALAASQIVGLVTKTDTNPFFKKMQEGALARAGDLGVELRTYAGTFDGDVDTQISAIEDLISSEANGILITPSDPVALAPVIARAREAGILVIALDTPMNPVDAADATFATDNFLAGELIGRWAAASLGDTSSAVIGTLDLSEAQVSVDVARNQGFLNGFGVDVGDASVMYDETDERVVGNGVTFGSVDGGRTAMENLITENPDINVVHTINEPAAIGAYQVLEEFGAQEDVLIVSVDGGCEGVRNVASGVIGATAMQFPLRMAALGVEAIVEFANTGTKPQTSEGLEFFNTGVELVTDQPVDGIPSISSADALESCW